MSATLQQPDSASMSGPVSSRSGVAVDKRVSLSRKAYLLSTFGALTVLFSAAEASMESVQQVFYVGGEVSQIGRARKDSIILRHP